MRYCLVVWTSFVTLLSSNALANQDYCREFTREVLIGGELQSAYGTTCLQPDGSWKILSEAEPEPVPQRPQRLVEQPSRKIIVRQPDTLIYEAQSYGYYGYYGYPYYGYPYRYGRDKHRDHFYRYHHRPGWEKHYEHHRKVLK